jgi:ribonuclease HI
LKPLVSEAVRRAKAFRRFAIAHVPREKNRDADRLANLGADASESLS